MYVCAHVCLCVCLFVYLCVSLSLFVCKLKHLKKAWKLVQADTRVPWLERVDPWTMTASVGLPCGIWWGTEQVCGERLSGGGKNQDEAEV